MGKMIALLSSWLLLAGSATCCADDDGAPQTAAECIAEYSVANGYDHASDNGGADVPELVAAEAADDDQPFETGDLITREAAVCIAELEQLEAGLEGWTVSLVYHYTHHRPIWNVENVLEFVSDSDQSGDGLAIDAITGEVLEQYSWQVIA